VHEELLETYIRVVYDAVREVDDSLSAINFMGKRLDAQGVAADSSLRAWNYSQEAFMEGAVDYLVVLDTQRTFQRNMDDLYNFRMERYRGLINLFSALGGGVPAGDVMPGEGTRPASQAGEINSGAASSEAGAKSKTGFDLTNKQPESSSTGVDTASQGKTQTEGVDWAGNALRSGSNTWLVELSGVYDRGAVVPAWRDLHARFAQQIENRTLLPQRQGQVNAAGKERASWYRLFIATFPDKKMAEEFCATLRAGQQRCSVVTSQSLAGSDGFAAPSTQEQAKISGAGAPVKMAAKAEAARLKAEQEVLLEADTKAARIKAMEEAKAAKLKAYWEEEAKAERLKAEQQTQNETKKQTTTEARQVAETLRMKAAQEARIAAEAEAATKQKVQQEADAKAAKIKAMEEAKAASLKAHWEAEAQAERLKTEQQARIEAEKQAATEARNAAKAEALRVNAEKQAKATEEAEAKAVKLKAAWQAEAEAERNKAETAQVKAEQKTRTAADAQSTQSKPPIFQLVIGQPTRKEVEAAQLNAGQQPEITKETQAAPETPQITRTEKVRAKAKPKAPPATDTKAVIIKAEEDAKAEAPRVKAEKLKAEAAKLKLEKLRAEAVKLQAEKDGLDTPK